MGETLREPTRGELERLRDEARALLARVTDGRPIDEAVADLALLQRLFDAAAPSGDLAATAFLFGERMRRDLGLRWMLREADGEPEPVVRYRDSEVVFYPGRLLRRQLATGARVDLAALLHATRDYLANLQRYALGERRPASAGH